MKLRLLIILVCLFFSQESKAQLTIDTLAESYVKVHVDSIASFPGGMYAMKKYLYSNIIYLCFPV